MKRLNIIKMILFLLFFILLVFQIKVMAVEGTITEITVNVREKASTDSKRVMYVTQDDKVEVLAKEGSWYKIKAKNKTGYVYSKYIKVDDSKLEQAKEDNSEEPVEEKNIKKEDNQDVTEDTQGKLIIKKGTQIRIIPNISSSTIETVEEEMFVTIIEQMNYWTYVSTDKIKGWVRTEVVAEENALDKKEEKEEQSTTNKNENNKEEEQNEEKQEEKKAYIKYDTVNLREKTTTSSKSLAKLKLNDEVTVLEKVNSVWTKIKVDGKTGYVSNDLLSDKKVEGTTKKETATSRDGESTSRENNNYKKEDSTTENKKELAPSEPKAEDKKETDSITKGEEIVAYAKKYLGYKYVYGGASPSTGFDCSGLTYYVYKHFGYTLSRSSSGQASNGTKVEKKDLQPGDLVIYKNTSLTRIGHVGIYIGDNKMIHASEPGVGVIITDIDSKAHKYPQRFVMGRRIIK